MYANGLPGTVSPWIFGPVHPAWDSRRAGAMGTRRDLALLREDLIGELQAITQYEQHAAQAVDPRVREVLRHIADEERHHVVELMRLISQLDPSQAQAFQRPHY